MKTEKLLNRYEECVKERAVFAHKNKELNCFNQQLRSKLKMSKQLLELQKGVLLDMRKEDIDKKIAFYNELHELGLLKENSIGLELSQEKKRILDETRKQDKDKQEDKIVEIMNKDEENELYNIPKSLEDYNNMKDEG